MMIHFTEEQIKLYDELDAAKAQKDEEKANEIIAKIKKIALERDKELEGIIFVH